MGDKGKAFERHVRETLRDENAVIVRLHDSRSGVMVPQPADFLCWSPRTSSSPFLVEVKDYPARTALSRTMFRPAQFRGIDGLETVIVARLEQGITVSLMRLVKAVLTNNASCIPYRIVHEHERLEYAISTVLL